MRRRFFVIALVLCAAACSGAQTAEEPAGPAPVEPVSDPAEPEGALEEQASAEESASEEAVATLSVKDSEVGEVLADAAGRTLYLHTRDQEGLSACTGGCAAAWPPLTVVGPPLAGAGADPSLLGVLVREDGSQQATYSGHPLYTYAGDASPGMLGGQGVGNVWFAVTPGGEPVGATSSEPTP